MDISRETLLKILECGVQAPSGDNCQPWRFCLEDDAVWLLNDTVRGRHFLNVSERASQTALGAVLENIQIAGSALGFAVDTELFPAGRQEEAVARLCLHPTEPSHEALFPFIHSRCTNRRRYWRRPLSESARQALTAAARQASGGDLILIGDAAQVDRLARIVSLMDRLLFEIRPLHRELFQCLRWDLGEVESTRDGLDVRTLELDRVARQLLPALQHRSIVEMLMNLGLGRVFQEIGYQNYRRSAVIGMIRLPGPSAEDFVKGGRLLQRLWLTATSHEVAFQPLAGIPILIHKLHHATVTEIPDRHQRMIAGAERELKTLLHFTEDHPALMLFRLGYADPPSAHALRRPVELLADQIRTL